MIKTKDARTEIEQELAYEWIGEPRLVSGLSNLADWKKSEEELSLTDSIYDTDDRSLGKYKMGVRVRSTDSQTTLTSKKFIESRPSGENIFEEQHMDLESNNHPATIDKKYGLKLPEGINNLQNILTFANNRHIFTFTKGKSTVQIINEVVSYANTNRVVTENLLEVEFQNVPAEVITAVKDELEAQYRIRQIHEGKTDRATRLLSPTARQPLIQNVDNIKPLTMSAHGGKGEISMKFFHQPYNHFFVPGIGPKVVGYEQANWDFFAYAELPIDAEVKEHLHDETDEIYFILDGSATVTVDGESQIIKKGDCILTRKGSRHSLTQVTETLKFIATEIRPRE